MYHHLEAGEERISALEGKAEETRNKARRLQDGHCGEDEGTRKTRRSNRGHCCPQGRDTRVRVEGIFGEITQFPKN